MTEVYAVDPMAVTPPATTDEYADIRRRLDLAMGRVCPKWLIDQRDDLVQVAVLRIMKRKADGQHEMNTSYLFKVAHSVVVDEIRRLRRRREDQLEIGDTDPPNRSGSPEHKAQNREVGVAIVHCLSTIRDGRRRAVTLHLQGHTVPEAARILGYNDKKTENLVYRGLADLRSCLEKKGLTP